MNDSEVAFDGFTDQRRYRRVVTPDGIIYVNPSGKQRSKPGRKAGIKNVQVFENDIKEKIKQNISQIDVAFAFMNVELPDSGKYAIRRNSVIKVVAHRTGKSEDSCAGTLTNKDGIYSSERFSQWVSCRIHNLTDDERTHLAQITYDGLSPNYGKSSHHGLLIHKEVLEQFPNIEPQYAKDFHSFMRQEERDFIFSHIKTEDPSIVLLPSEDCQDVITAENRFREPEIYGVEYDYNIYTRMIENKGKKDLVFTDYYGTLLSFLKTKPDKQFTLINYDGAQYCSPESIETAKYINDEMKTVYFALLMQKVVEGFRGNAKILIEWKNKYSAVHDKNRALITDTMSNYNLVGEREWKTKAVGSRTMRLFMFKLK